MNKQRSSNTDNNSNNNNNKSIKQLGKKPADDNNRAESEICEFEQKSVKVNGKDKFVFW